MQKYLEEAIDGIAKKRGYAVKTTYNYANQGRYYFMKDGKCGFHVNASFHPDHVSLYGDQGAPQIMRADGVRPMTCWYAKNEDMDEFYAYFEKHLA